MENLSDEDSEIKYISNKELVKGIEEIRENNRKCIEL